MTLAYSTPPYWPLLIAPYRKPYRPSLIAPAYVTCRIDPRLCNLPYGTSLIEPRSRIEPRFSILPSLLSLAAFLIAPLLISHQLPYCISLHQSGTRGVGSNTTGAVYMEQQVVYLNNQAIWTKGYLNQSYLTWHNLSLRLCFRLVDQPFVHAIESI